MKLRDNIHAHLKLDPATGCLEWTRFIDKAGYGRVRYDGESGYLHRFVWEQAHGEIPKGLVVRHTCDNPCCGNLKHLVLGTQADNIQDREERGRGRNGINRPYNTRSRAKPATLARRAYEDFEAYLAQSDECVD